MKVRVAETDDLDLDEAARRVAETLHAGHERASRSLLLAIFADALGSEERARASLEELEERLRVWGAWTPPPADHDRVEVRMVQRPEGYRFAAAGALEQLTLRPQPLEHALHIASPIVVFALAVFFLIRQDWIAPALWIPFAVLQLILYLRRRKRRDELIIELDDRTLRAGDAELAREDVRYVTSQGHDVTVGLVDGQRRVLLAGLPIDDADALAAGLEAELRLLPGGASPPVRMRVAEPVEREDDEEERRATPWTTTRSRRSTTPSGTA